MGSGVLGINLTTLTQVCKKASCCSAPRVNNKIKLGEGKVSENEWSLISDLG